MLHALQCTSSYEKCNDAKKYDDGAHVERQLCAMEPFCQLVGEPRTNCAANESYKVIRCGSDRAFDGGRTHYGCGQQGVQNAEEQSGDDNEDDKG